MVTSPAELADQARYLYGRGLGSALVAAAIERGWTVEPSQAVGFWNSSPATRLYMRQSIGQAAWYAACWEDEDALRRIGGNFAQEDIKHEL